MAKKTVHRAGFTLIEVMVAVMIISVVILALIQMYANNTHIFSSMKQQSKINQYSSFLISNDNYGFKDKNIYLDALVEDFNLEDDLRRQLKEMKVEIVYQEVDTIDMSEFDGSQEEEAEDIDESDEEDKESSNANMVFEVGKTVLKIDNTSGAILRIRLQ